MTVNLPERSRLVGAANRILPVLHRARLLPEPVLDGAAMMEQAARQTGLADFGDPWFRRPLGDLLKALREEARLNPLGLFAAHGQLGKVLRDRLIAAHLLAAHPEIGQRRLARPVIVVGPMRSGTTRLHRLLAADQRFAHLRAFETVNPVPHAQFRPGDRDRRWIAARLALGAIHAANPVMAHIHPSGPFAPAEELGLLVRSFWGLKLEAQWHVPGYGRWCEGEDATPAYSFMADLLRLVGWARGEDDARPWVLKTPQHMLDLPALFAVFPDARLIFTHRQPRAVVGSSCSLVWNQTIIHSDHADAHGIGREWLGKTQAQIERMRAARLAIPAHQQIDVQYDEMESDWMATMRRIYAFLDLEIEPALAAMQSYVAQADHALGRYPHSYALAAFGLDPREVDERFIGYVEEFGLGGRASRAQTRVVSTARPRTGISAVRTVPVPDSVMNRVLPSGPP